MRSSGHSRPVRQLALLVGVVLEKPSAADGDLSVGEVSVRWMVREVQWWAINARFVALIVFIVLCSPLALIVGHMRYKHVIEKQISKILERCVTQDFITAGYRAELEKFFNDRS
jgi:hypothetical protein